MSKLKDESKAPILWHLASERLKLDSDYMHSKYLEFYVCVPCEMIFLAHSKHGLYLDILDELDPDLAAALLACKIKE